MESDVQMTLALDSAFLRRLQYLMTQQARTILAETGIGSTHAVRIQLARRVIVDAENVAHQAAPMIVGGVNVISGGASTTDAALLSQIATFWNALAGIDTGN